MSRVAPSARVRRFPARCPELRDAIGDFGNSPLTGNARRIVDTGLIAADSATVIGTEFLFIRGPFSVQSEYAFASINNAQVAGTPVGDRWFNGGYIQVSYFLTGENRTYDRRLGRLGDTYIASPYAPFFFTRAEDGRFQWGRGAWEIAARFNHLTLDNGLIQGGQTNSVELGLNWYLNTNLKVQFEYLHQNRYDMGPGQVPGDIDALGIRTQFFF